MWYKTALKYNYFGQLIQGNPKNQFKVRNFAEEEDLENEEDVVNQDLPLDVTEEEPVQQEEPVFTPVPVQITPQTDTPVGVENRAPKPINLPPNFKAPPIHEFCHCEIVTMPGGRQVWRLGNGENHCNECVENMRIFNAANQDAYGT